MSEPAKGADSGLFSEQPAGEFDRFQIAIRDLPTCVRYIPLKLSFNIANEFVRFSDVHF